jgi:hypothetical protein
MYLDSADDEPFEILSEVSEAGFETRKIVSYIDGRRVRIDASSASDLIGLKREPFPSVAELKRLDAFVEEHSEEFFEEQWAAVR